MKAVWGIVVVLLLALQANAETWTRKKDGKKVEATLLRTVDRKLEFLKNGKAFRVDPGVFVNDEIARVVSRYIKDDMLKELKSLGALKEQDGKIKFILKESVQAEKSVMQVAESGIVLMKDGSNVVALATDTKGRYEGETISGRFYPDGIYTYTSVDNARRQVAMFRVMGEKGALKELSRDALLECDNASFLIAVQLVNFETHAYQEVKQDRVERSIQRLAAKEQANRRMQLEEAKQRNAAKLKACRTKLTAIESDLAKLAGELQSESLSTTQKLILNTKKNKMLAERGRLRSEIGSLERGP